MEEGNAAELLFEIVALGNEPVACLLVVLLVFVECLFWEQAVGGSNPSVQTILPL